MIEYSITKYRGKCEENQVEKRKRGKFLVKQTEGLCCKKEADLREWEKRQVVYYLSYHLSSLRHTRDLADQEPFAALSVR